MENESLYLLIKPLSNKAVSCSVIGCDGSNSLKKSKTHRTEENCPLANKMVTIRNDAILKQTLKNQLERQQNMVGILLNYINQ